MGRSLGHGADAAVGEPELLPAVRGAGREVAVVRLVEEASGLRLGVLAVLVGQEVDPDLARAREVPDPDLSPRHVVVAGPMAEAGVLSLVPPAVEVLVFADREIALGVRGRVVPVEGQVPARAVHRPGFEGHGVVVADVPPAGEDVLEVLGRLDRGAGPCVVRLGKWRRVDPQRVGLEHGPVPGKSDGDAPARPGGEVHGPDDAADAPVGIAAQDIIDGRSRRRGMPDDAEVELDAARSPGTPEGDLAELQGPVPVEEIPARGLLGGSPDLAADLRQHGDLDVRVRKADDRPLPVRPFGREAVEEKVGIEARALPPHGRAGEDGHGVRVRERVGPDDLGPLFDPGAERFGGEAAGRGRDEGGGQGRGDGERRAFLHRGLLVHFPLVPEVRSGADGRGRGASGVTSR